MVIGRDGGAARLIVPDPRYFALHKLWLAEKPGRSATKAPKDRSQGLLVLDALAAHSRTFRSTKRSWPACRRRCGRISTLGR